MLSEEVLALINYQKLNWYLQALRKETYHFSHVGSCRADDSPFVVVGIQEFLGLRRDLSSKHALDEEID